MCNRRSFVLLVILLTCIICVNAQKSKNSISGKVLDSNGDPAVSVNIILQKNGRMTVTDAQGNFSLVHLPVLTDTLLISSIGTNYLFLPVTLQENTQANLGILTLTNNYQSLATVEIKGRMQKSYKSDYSYYGTKTQTPLKNIPQAISTVTKELIRDKMDFTLRDAVDEVAGVNMYSGYEEYTIRGLRAENPHNINGLRGYNTSYTSSMLVNIERIEVIKGPTATLYGNCDPGGTINLVTKKPLDTKSGELAIFQGSWNHWRAEGDITGPMNKRKTLLYRLNAGYDQSNSFRNQLSANSWQVAPSFTYTPNNRLQLNLDLSVSHINTVLDRGAPGFRDDQTVYNTAKNISVSQPGDYLHETDFSAIATLAYKINKRLSFNSGLLTYITRQEAGEHGLNNYITNDSVSLFYHEWSYPTITNTWTNYFTYSFMTGRLSHQLVAGYDYIRSELEPTANYFEIPDEFGTGSGIVGGFNLRKPQYQKRSRSKYQVSTYDHSEEGGDENIYQTHGIYLQDQVTWNRWKLLFSVREEMFRAGEDEATPGAAEEEEEVTMFLPRVGLVYAINPDINIYATYNKGFDPLEPTSTAQVFNEPFKPLVSELLEVGSKGNFLANKLAASIAIYQIRLKNVAVSANDMSNPNRYIQIGEVKSTGVETELSGNISKNLGVMISYAYCDARITHSKVAEQIGMPTENAPKHSSSSWIKYQVNSGVLKGFALAIGHAQVGIRNTLKTGFLLPGYTVLNAALQYRYQHLNFAVNLNNITNKEYWSGGYNSINKWAGTPRNYTLRVGYTL